MSAASTNKKARKDASAPASDKNFEAREKQAWERVQANVSLYSHQSLDVREKSVRLARFVMDNDPIQYKSIGASIRSADNDDARDFARKAMQRSGREYGHIPPNLRNEPSDFAFEMAKMAIAANPTVYMTYIAHEIKHDPVHARELAVVAVTADPDMYKHVPTELTSADDDWSKELALQAVTESDLNYKFVPDNLMHSKTDPDFSRRLAEAARTRVFAHMPMELKRTAQPWLKDLGKLAVSLRYEEYQFLPWRGARDAYCRELADRVVTASRGDHYKHVPLNLRGEESEWAFKLAQTAVGFSPSCGSYVPAAILAKFGVAKCAEMWATDTALPIPDGMRDLPEFKNAVLAANGALYRDVECFMLITDTEENRTRAEIAIRCNKMCGYAKLPFALRNSQCRPWAIRMALFASKRYYMYKAIPLNLRNADLPLVDGVPISRVLMRNAIASSPKMYEYVPERIRETLSIEETEKLVRDHSHMFSFLPKSSEVRNNVELCAQIVRRDSSQYLELSSTMQRSVPIIMQVLMARKEGNQAIVKIPKDALSQPGIGDHERDVISNVFKLALSERDSCKQLGAIYEWFIFEQPKAMMVIDPTYYTKWSRERELAIFMSLHARLGENSPLRILGEANIRDLIIERSNNQYFYTSNRTETVPRVERFQLIEEAKAKEVDFGDATFMHDILKDLLD